MSAFGCAVCPLTECAFVLMPEQQKCISTQVSLKAKGFFCVRANLWASLYLCVCVCVFARVSVSVYTLMALVRRYKLQVVRARKKAENNNARET